MPVLAQKDYEYTVRFYAGGQGTFADGSEVIVYRKSYGEQISFDRDEIVINNSKYYIKGIRKSGKDNSDADHFEGYRPQAYNLTKTLSANAAENIFTFIYSAAPEPGSSGTGGTGGGGEERGEQPDGRAEAEDETAAPGWLTGLLLAAAVVIIGGIVLLIAKKRKKTKG